MTAHSNNRDLIADHQPWVGEVQVPASVSNLLEYRMAPSMATRPSDTPSTCRTTLLKPTTRRPPKPLEQVSRSADLQIPLGDLAEAAESVQTKIDEQVQGSPEVAQVVSALESQYDAFVTAQENRSLLARDEDLPSGDELGAEFEKFLAQHTEDFKDGGADGLSFDDVPRGSNACPDSRNRLSARSRLSDATTRPRSHVQNHRGERTVDRGEPQSRNLV